MPNSTLGRLAEKMQNIAVVFPVQRIDSLSGSRSDFSHKPASSTRCDGFRVAMLRRQRFLATRAVISLAPGLRQCMLRMPISSDCDHKIR